MTMAIILSVVLVAGSGLLWWALGPDIRSRVTPLQAGTLAFFVLFMVAFMLVVGFSWTRADEKGLVFRNGLFTHRLAWGEISRIVYREGDPWAFAYLVEDHPSGRDRYMLMGIQQTDGARAVELAKAVAAQRPTPGN